MRYKKPLAVLKRISTTAPDIVADIYPKGEEHIYNYRRTHSKKGYIYEVLTNSSSGYSYFFTDIGTNPEHLPFDKVSESVHTAKLKNK